MAAWRAAPEGGGGGGGDGGESFEEGVGEEGGDGQVGVVAGDGEVNVGQAVVVAAGFEAGGGRLRVRGQGAVGGVGGGAPPRFRRGIQPDGGVAGVAHVAAG